MFDGAELLRFAEQATWLAFNDYEAKLMQERTGKTPEQLAQMVEAVFITLGGEGSYIYTRNKVYEIPAAPVANLQDPTGCGDAYRAGLLYGLMQNADWEVTGRIGALMGAIKIEHPGTQNHKFTGEEFAARFKESFGFSF
jgi:adenosine kinase